LKFGFCLPIFAGAGDVHPRTPLVERVDADQLKSSILAAEDLGYESLWVADHLMMGRDEAILEGWTTMCWAAGLTSRIKIGSIHLSNLLRSPSMTAKIASTLDVISKGRLELFFEMGHRGTRAESEAYGFEFMEDSERLADFEEAVQIIKLMWTEGVSSFDGKHNSIDGAVNHPLPVQRPHPPLWIGALGTEISSTIAPNEQVLDIAAKYADGWNSTPVSPEQCRLMLDGLRKACDRAGGDFGSIKKSVETQIMLAPTRCDVDRLCDEVSERNPSLYDDAGWKQAEEQYLIGDPETVIARISEYRSIGIDYMQLWFMDMPSEQGLRTFAESVAPAFSGR
jgi:alkanesulfonate monooxygenase SsuD/methylene tetrahydromethanopterin reductase-like flavin-dependent oxidoreductase (luciferase family)